MTMASRGVHAVRFPGESGAYREARDALLSAEIDLRRRVEEVAALRRRLPLGGAVPTDYVFEEGAPDLADTATTRPVRLSELFGDQDSLVLYSFMYSPSMPKACPMCTSVLDSLDGAAVHAAQRASLAVVAKSPIARIRAFARERGWRRLRLVSSAGTTYNRDYHGETPDGAQIPALNVFVRRNGAIHHFYATELLFAPHERGQNARHVDPIWPLWNLLDMTPGGRGDWYPRLAYGAADG